MQLHHFAHHQQGGHRGVFRQVFELLQCAGYRLLIVAGTAEITATGVVLSRPWAIS